MRLIPFRSSKSNTHCIGKLLASLLLLTSTSVWAESGNPDTLEASSSVNGSEVNQMPLPLQDLRLITLVFDHIRRAYVEPVSDQELLENAIKGMLQELDPHSSYLDANSFSVLQESTKGEFSGVGLEIGTEDGYIKVITPVDGSPAANAGLQAGDLIIKLDNKSIRGFSLSEAAKRMRGPKGTTVTITVIRQDRSKPISFTVIRDTIKSQSVRTRILQEDFGYLRISQFQSNTGKDFVKAINELHNETSALKGIILDLRNNPGGVLQASIEVVDALLEEGLVVYTEGRLANSRQSFYATPGDLARGLPMVVLINGGSASAAEIVAGALQDHHRAIIMGTTSFGKGSVQTVLPVGQEKGIKLTTALYFTPQGRSIQAQGIIPDVEVRRATITELEEGQRFKEANLSGHLSSDNEKDLEDDNRQDAEATLSRQDTLADNQLFEALNMLKGLAIFNQARRP